MTCPHTVIDLRPGALESFRHLVPSYLFSHLEGDSEDRTIVMGVMGFGLGIGIGAVSYTHLTLPTN